MIVDRVRNDEIRERVVGAKVAIVDVARSWRLSWFGHVVEETTLIQSTEKFNNPRPRGRPPGGKTKFLNDTGLQINELEEIAVFLERYHQKEQGASPRLKF